jgi:lipopolysaccharide transport system ATP-binding protein
MSNLAIRVENLGKLYRIGSKQQSYYTLRDALVDAVMTPVRRVRGLLRGESAADLHEEIWALKDVSFEVKHGEVVGIIGRNGAGKSTLLKVLSRITEPTTGCADVYGRIGALLEVGTGFHPELTGRENIYLNGAILGMSRAEINRKFDEIVDFAGVEKFIDTPVKHYSSGMGLRLGFAVAAHLEPEILIVDEVLAVGDAEFQKKCLGKMSNVASEGRTVLFVSHNMAAVQSLCKRAILLSEGAVILDDEAETVISKYLQRYRTNSSAYVSNVTTSQPAQIKKIRILSEDGIETDNLLTSDSFQIEVVYEVRRASTRLNLSVSVFSSNETCVLSSPSFSDANWYRKEHPVGLYVARCFFPGSFFNRGYYTFSVMLVRNGHEVIEKLDNIVKIELNDDPSQLGGYFGFWGGVVRPMLQWRVDGYGILED